MDQNSGSMLRAILEQGDDVVMRFDAQCRHLYVSPQVTHIVPMKPADFLGKTHRELGFPEELSQFWESRIQQVFASARPLEEEFQVEGLKGALWMEWRLFPELDQEGQVLSVLSLARDITPRRRTREALEISEKRLQKALADRDIQRNELLRIQAIAQMGSWEWDLNSDTLSLSEPLRQMLGLEGPETNWSWSQWMERIHEEDRLKLMQALALCVETGLPLDFQWRSLGEELRWFRTLGEGRPDPSGKIREIRGYTQDISEYKRAEQLQQDLERLSAKSQMAGFIAHEINNPVAGIKNSFLLIKDAIPQDHPDYEFVRIIEREIERISGIIRTVYQLYRSSPNQEQAVDLEQTLTDISLLISPKLKQHRVQFQFRAPKGKVEGHLVEGHLRQILFNLLQNALEASPPGSEVHCDVFLSEGLRIQIVDEGTGIAPAHQVQVFRSGFSTKAGLGSMKGLGLGLSTCKTLVEAMKGSISFHSNPAGKGTIFELYFPHVRLAA